MLVLTHSQCCLSLTIAGSAAVVQTPSSTAAASANITSYTAEFFSQFAPNTAYDMVVRLPGFRLDGGNSIRGFGGAAGNVVIDGQRPTNKTDDLASILERIPAALVARIDVIRGAAPGIDMQGKTIVANVVLRKTGGFSGAAQYGQYAIRQGYLDPDGELEGRWRDESHSFEGSILASTGHRTTEGSGPRKIRNASGRLLDNSQSRNSEPHEEYKATAAAETPLAGGRLRANFTFDAQPFILNSIDVFRVAGREAEVDRQTANVTELGLHFDRQIMKNARLELIGLRQSSQTDLTSDFQALGEDQRFHLNNRRMENVGRVVLHWTPSTKVGTEGGGEYAYNTLEARTAFNVNGAAVLLPAANVRVTEGRGEAFGILTWRPFNTFSFEAELRVEKSVIVASGDVASSRSLTFAKPRLVASWSPTSHSQIRMRLEREVTQLDFNQFVATASLNNTGILAGNPNLLPQQDWTFEAAYEHRFWQNGVASLTVRYLALADVIDRAPVIVSSGVFDSPANIGNGRETDLIANFNIPLEKMGLTGVTARGMATLRVSRVTDPTTHGIRRISGQHPLDAEFHLTQDLPRQKIGWGLELFSAARERFFRSNEIDTNLNGAYADLYVDYKPRPDVAFRIQLNTTSHFKIEQAMFKGPRNMVGSPNTTDTQKRSLGPFLFMRLRKTF